MKTALAFMKKDWTDQLRSAKFYILIGVFILFGIMNPVTAKITPWLFDILSESLEGSGMNIQINEVTALDSWAQFYKNISTALITFVLIESNILAKEIRSGTLILALTKGLDRYKVVISKSVVLTVLWTVCYWLCFAVTYCGNLIFWDNGIAQNLMFSAVCGWVFGLFICGVVVLASAIFGGNILVLAVTGGVSFVLSLLIMLPKVMDFIPTLLSDGTSLVYGLTNPNAYYKALAVTVVLTVACFVASIPVFNKKQL